jgi:hypothetical protein
LRDSYRKTAPFPGRPCVGYRLPGCEARSFDSDVALTALLSPRRGFQMMQQPRSDCRFCAGLQGHRALQPAGVPHRFRASDLQSAWPKTIPFVTNVLSHAYLDDYNRKESPGVSGLMSAAEDACPVESCTLPRRCNTSRASSYVYNLRPSRPSSLCRLPSYQNRVMTGAASPT